MVRELFTVSTSRWAAILTLLAACAGGVDAADYQEVEIDGRKAMFLSSRDVSTTIVSVKVEGVEFHLPVNRLSTTLEADPIVRDELRGGFTFVGLLPGIEPRTKDNLAFFLSPRAIGRLVTVTVGRSCPTNATPDCTPESSLRSRMKIETPELYPTGPDLRTASVEGLSLVGHSRDRAERAPTKDLFVLASDPDNAEFIVCNRPGAVPIPHCTHRLVWRSGLRLVVFYARPNLADWQSIRTAAIRVIKTKLLATTSDTPPTLTFPSTPQEASE